MRRKIFFYVQFNALGGEAFMLSKMINWLCNQGYDITCIDCKGSIFFKYIKQIKLDINLLEIDGTDYTSIFQSFKKIKNIITNKDIIITNIEFIYQNYFLINFAPLNAKLLFYAVEPHSLSNVKRYKNRFKTFFHSKKIKNNISYLKNLLEIANNKNGLIYQDLANYNNILQYNKNSLKRYLPIPIKLLNVCKKDFNKKYIRCCWVGRAVRSKLSMLFFIINQLNTFAQNNDIQIELNCISDDISKIKRKIITKQNIHLNFINFMKPDNLQEFLLKNIDICFGNGVSVLDAANCGCIVIIVPSSNKKIPKNTNVYTLNDFKEYTLGGYLNEIIAINEGYNIQYLINYAIENHHEIVKKQYDYISNNFDIEKVMRKFLFFVNNTSLNVGDLINVSNNRKK